MLITGGFDSDLMALASAEVFDPATGNWTRTGDMVVGRAQHTAALLNDGRVLVIGGLGPDYNLLNSVETYDPATGVWSQHMGTIIRRRGHTSVGLVDGSVLTMGGVGELVQQELSRNQRGQPLRTTLERESSIDAGSEIPISAVMYDPSTDSLADAGALLEGRSEHTATLLSDGRVLVMGGFGPRQNAARMEMYDPTTQSWSPAGPEFSSLTVAHSATLLNEGTVLLAGGIRSGLKVSVHADVYDPATEELTATRPMREERMRHTATLLKDGRVLIVGGSGKPGSLATAELFDPIARVWSLTRSMAQTRASHTATLLNDGRVLVVGGSRNTITEIYDPVTGSWSTAGS